MSFHFRFIGPTGEIEREYVVEGDKRADLIEAMAEAFAPNAVRSWVHHNGTHRPLKWSYDGGRRTVRVTREES